MAKRRAGLDEAVPCNTGRQFGALASAYLAANQNPAPEVAHAFAEHLEQVEKTLDDLRAQVLRLNKHNGLYRPPSATQFYTGEGVGLHAVMLQDPQQLESHKVALAARQQQLAHMTSE